MAAADAATISFCFNVQRRSSSSSASGLFMVRAFLPSERTATAAALGAAATKLAAVGMNTALQLPQRTRPASRRSSGTPISRHKGHCKGGSGANLGGAGDGCSPSGIARTSPEDSFGEAGAVLLIAPFLTPGDSGWGAGGTDA